jgi:CheY-like chemotaxis protein
LQYDIATDALRVCESAVLGLRDEAAARDLALNFACDGPLPGSLEIDETALRGAVRELTAAAIATAEHTVTLTIAYARGALHVEADDGRRCGRLHLTAAPAAGAAEAEAPSLEGLRVLVVDDCSVNRALARTLLTRLGVEVSEAEDGAAALERAEVEAFDAILMDIRMPGLSGHQALTALRKGAGPNAEAPVLAFTANVGPEERAVRRLNRFDGIVRKPVAPAQMQLALAAIAGRAFEELQPQAAHG